MLGQNQARRVLEQALARSRAEETEALLLGEDSALTRFAQNAIHQNVAESNAVLRLRAVVGNRVGVASGNDLSAQGIADLCARALEAAQALPPDPHFPGLPHPQPYPALPAVEPETARVDPAARAALVGEVCSLADARGLVAAGALETAIREIAVANSNGVSAYQARTSAEFVTVVMSDDSSGYGFSLGNSLAELDIEASARRAVDKALSSRRPRSLSPGHYAVILEPDATADLLGSMAYTAFGAQQVEEGSSFLAGRLGTPVLASAVSIADDALNPAALPMAFDYEGWPKSWVSIIEDGVAAGVVHDTYTAARAGVTSTGHALPAPNPHGPQPTHLALSPGTASLEELVASVGEGLLVTRFHYTRVVDPASVTVTGMTRDGTFYIRGGEIAFPVRNLRFTQSYVRAIQDGIRIGRDRRLAGEYGPYLCPAVYIPDFHFTGVTEF